MTAKKGTGFAPPNYTQTPNTLFDMLPVISNAELRITLALVRETHGWHRQRTDMLSVTELAGLAGLSESSAKTGIKEAMQRGTLKRFKTRDAMNRPTFKYGMVIRDDVPREEFERPKKPQENPEQDVTQTGSSGRNLTGSEFNGVTGSSGQNLTPSPENSSGQNLTPSYKEQRNPFEGKKVEEENAGQDESETGPEHDDDFLFEEDKNTPPLEGGEGQAHTSITGARNDLEGGNGTCQATDGEDVPPAAAADWSPAGVNHEISVLTNKRWQRKWQPRGSKDWSDPLIYEVDGTGVDRHRIAHLVSPAQLAKIAESIRVERARLITASHADPSVKVYTFQHLLIQALQAAVLRADEMRRQVQAFAQQCEPAAPAAPSNTPITRDWKVGDIVTFQRERYAVEKVTETYIDLYDEQNGTVKVTRASREMASVKLIEKAQEAS
ncbi:hypothetical protein [Deinococcus enclensis]|uniref:Helix-turn-helix domain-containing protein n=1 Tax=Deinococcus enclensis TaxID=1049582 RepID=A0ABT9MG62_9DEIO|nr:hypothetical protein [Deinococcus enclensis]MDP9765561.1 hypothetical protein [Deinococcus enclensis]